MPQPPQSQQSQQQSVHKLLCMCHLVSNFNGQKWICQLLCLHNLRYDEATQRFALGQQLLVSLAFVYYLLCGTSFLCGFPGSIDLNINSYTFGGYLLPTIHYLLRRRSLLHILNDMLHVHRRLQRAMGPLFCVALKRAFCWSWLMALELLAILYWDAATLQLSMWFFQLFFLLGWYLQILLHANSYIWLQSIYAVMNQAFVAPLNHHQRWLMVKRLLRVQPRLRQIQRDVACFFSVYTLSCMVLMAFRFAVSFDFEEYPAEGRMVVALRFEVLILRYIAILFLLIGSLFVVMNDFATERNRFLTSLWLVLQEMSHRRIQDCRHSTKYLSRHEQQLDAIDMLILSGNQPGDMRPTNTILWEVRIESKVECTSTLKSFINWLLRLLLLAFLVPLVALSNGFDLTWGSYILQNDTLASWNEMWTVPMKPET